MPVTKQTNFKIVKAQTTFAKAITTWKLVYKEDDGADYMELLATSVAVMKGHIAKFRQKWHSLKFNMSLHIIFEVIDASIITEPAVVLVGEQMEVYRHRCG